MKATLEPAHPMIAANDEERLLIGARHRFADNGVAGAVMILDGAVEFGPHTVLGSLPGRMLRRAEPPEHMLHAVGRVEETEEEAFFKPVEFVQHHPLAFAQDDFALR